MCQAFVRSNLLLPLEKLRVGTVASAHEDPQLENLQVDLDRYPEVEAALRFIGAEKATPPEIAKVPESEWQYGYGPYDAAADKLVPPHFSMLWDRDVPRVRVTDEKALDLVISGRARKAFDLGAPVLVGRWGAWRQRSIQ